MDLTRALIADAAAVQNGKLYVHGGGWDTLFLPQVPATYPSLALAFVLRVDARESPSQIPIEIGLVDDQGQAHPLHINGTVSVGQAGPDQVGGSIFVPQAVTVNFLELGKLGHYRFVIRSNREVLAEVPFRVLLATRTPVQD
ncbi:MAG TPA: hypothetical protein VG015_00635 [Candidatus Dormibacteraeota bacterium]|jgi:hypothetical protein|nr:hypothetical protein [Candidatus Dormibacteraeota bacterium]